MLSFFKIFVPEGKNILLQWELILFFQHNHVIHQSKDFKSYEKLILKILRLKILPLKNCYVTHISLKIQDNIVVILLLGHDVLRVLSLVKAQNCITLVTVSALL